MIQRRISGMSKDESRSNRGYIHVYTEKDKSNRKNAKGSRGENSENPEITPPRHGGIQSTKCSSFIENRCRGRKEGRKDPVFLLDLARS